MALDDTEWDVPLPAARRSVHFELFRDKQGGWRWRMRAANGQVTGTSGEAFASKWNAKRALLRVAAAASTAAIRG